MEKLFVNRMRPPLAVQFAAIGFLMLTASNFYWHDLESASVFESPMLDALTCVFFVVCLLVAIPWIRVAILLFAIGDLSIEIVHLAFFGVPGLSELHKQFPDTISTLIIWFGIIVSIFGPGTKAFFSRRTKKKTHAEMTQQNGGVEET